jgi:hypothetical protein
VHPHVDAHRWEPDRYTNNACGYPAVHSGEPLRFEFDEVVLAEVSHLHEWAGLFAWRETLVGVRTWKSDRLACVVAHALATIEMARGGVAQCAQVALFDAESGQWHFEPRRSTDVVAGRAS